VLQEGAKETWNFKEDDSTRGCVRLEILVVETLFIYGIFNDFLSCLYYIASNGTILVYNELKNMYKKVVVSYFDVLFRNLAKSSYENQEEPQSQ
jgi:hypothetical protein